MCLFLSTPQQSLFLTLIGTVSSFQPISVYEEEPSKQHFLVKIIFNIS